MSDARTYKNELDLKAYPNELTPDIDTDYTVKVNTKEQSLNSDDIANDMALLSGKYSSSEIRHLMDLETQAVARAVSSGYNVTTDLYYARPVASGVLMEEELSQPVDREKVKVYASLSAGSELKKAMEQTKLNLFLQPATTGPYVAGMTSTEFTDDAAQTRAPMAGGEMAVITGRNIKLVGTDPTVGITLTSATNPAVSFFIPARRVNPNTASRLQFVLPAGVTEGEWLVKVTTQYASGGGSTKTTRTYQMARPIVIGEATTGGGGETGGGSTGGGDEENPFG